MSHLNVGSVGRLIPNDESSCSRCYLLTQTFNGGLAMRLWALVTTSLGFTSSFVHHAPLLSLNRIVRSIVITEERGKRTTSIGFGLGYHPHQHHHHNFYSGGGNSESERTARLRLYARKGSRNGNSRLKRPKGGGGRTPSDEQINREGVLEVNPL